MVRSLAHVLLSILVLCSSFASGAIHRSPTLSPPRNQSLVVHCGRNVAEVLHPFTRSDADGSWSWITCNEDDGNFRIKIDSFEYYVTSVDYAARTLVVRSVAADDQLDFDVCPSLLNNSMDVAPFGYTRNDVLVTQIRNCSGESADALPVATWRRHGCCYTTGDPAFVQSVCGESQTQFMPVMRSQTGPGNALEGDGVDIWKALGRGFEVTWAPAWGCQACEQSGGVCRSLWAPHTVTYCYCPRDGVAYIYECPSQDCCNPDSTGRTDEGKGHKSPMKFVIDLDGRLISSSIMTEAEGELARRMVVIGLWCIQTNPSDRPSMSKALDMLEGRIAELQMPPMPFLSSPLVSANNFAAVDQSQEQVSVDASSSIQSCRDTLEPES